MKLAPARSPFTSSWSSLVRLIGFNLAIGTLIDHKLLLSFRRFRLCSLLRMLVSLVSPDSYHAIYILDVLRYTFSFYTLEIFPKKCRAFCEYAIATCQCAYVIMAVLTSRNYSIDET